jgi:hypothetical protein
MKSRSSGFDMSEIAERCDPIGDKHFKPLDRAERWSDVSFYVAGVLSFAMLLVDKAQFPAAYDVVQIVFVLSVLSVFVSNVAIRLYWRPNAEDRRREELITNACDVSLTIERTQGYYNNDEVDPTRRLGVALLENGHFSRAITFKMLTMERIKIAAYVVLFLVAVLYRKTDLALAAAAAQAVFSEQLLSRWLRLEWLHARFNAVYRQLYTLFQSKPNKRVLFAKILELFALYEAGKLNAGISLSSKIFFDNNKALSGEWESIKAALQL